jgi:PadR family transcriptional regulator, regulatory protein PadR
MATPSKFELPQGTLDLLILRVVSLGPVHGYAIAQRIKMISKEALQIQQGSLYPALHRLENKNFLVAEWGPTETGREAKFYQLTAKGRTHLKTETESWECLTAVVGMILQHPIGEPS